MADIASGESIEEYLNQHDTLTYRNVGVSMLPMLRQGRDLFTVKKKTEERCRKYDVVLFRKSPHVYLLHRVIKVRPDDYVMMGDNTITKEEGIKDRDILGVMTSFVHNGRQYRVNDLRYRLYIHLWVGLYRPARLFVRRAWRKASRMIRNGK